MQPYQDKYKFRYNTTSCIQYILQYTVYTVYSIYNIQYKVYIQDTLYYTIS